MPWVHTLLFMGVLGSGLEATIGHRSTRELYLSRAVLVIDLLRGLRGQNRAKTVMEGRI